MQIRMIKGERIVGSPEYTGSLWTSYQFDNGVSVGGGLQYVGERLALSDPNFDGDTSDRVYVDGYTVFNAFVGYTVQDWDFQLNLQNLTDKEYVHAAWGGLSRSVHAGHPFEAVLTARYNF